jgi:hypothetical protein
MSPSSIVDITISNLSKETFNYILVDIITAIVNLHFNTDYLPEEFSIIYISKMEMSEIWMLTTWCY